MPSLRDDHDEARLIVAVGRLRRTYYDIFSHFYDALVRLHSKDAAGRLRSFLADRADLQEGNRVLDLCTGTGAVVLELAARVGPSGLAVGLDFSGGMLARAQAKARTLDREVALVLAEAGGLPFREGAFAAVTCSHAFYELDSAEREKALREVCRVLRPGGCLLMMEHERPLALVPRILFYVRMFTMGSRDAAVFLRDDTAPFRAHFSRVLRQQAPTGRSKLIVATKAA